MPREVRTELADLIATGRCNWHTTVDIHLTGGDDLYLSSGEIFVDRFGKTQQYLAKLPPDGIDALSMTLGVEVDQMPFKTENVDRGIGQLLTGAVRQMDGAQATVGILFIDPVEDLDQAIYDAKMPGELMSGEVNDETVDFTLISSIDSIIVSGRTISEEFQWQEPSSNIPSVDPNDLPGHFPNGGPGFEPTRRPPGGGRYGELEPLADIPY